MGKWKMLGRLRKNRAAPPPERRAVPHPPLMTYDPYLIKLVRRVEASKGKPNPDSKH